MATMNTNAKLELAKKACVIIFANEGGYDSINMNDNGAVSIGRIQWHGNRAKQLLQTICKNRADAKDIIGSALYKEILGGNSWGNRIVNNAEAAVLKKLLQTPESHKAQDDLAISDVVSYIDKGLSYGLTDPNALIYFADGVNQYGTGASLWKKIAEYALARGGTLDAMFEGTKALTSNYMSRRQRVYQKLKNDATDINVGNTTSKPANTGFKKIIPDKTNVKMIQQWINNYVGEKLTIDGSFGPKSKTGMVKALQHYINTTNPAVRLVEDGSFGPKTSAACPYVSMNHLNKGELAFIAQCLLYVNGYDPQGLDSSFGQNTKKAAVAYQSDHNLTPDGEVGKLTFKKLVA